MNNRRNFMKTSLVASAGIMAAVSTSMACPDQPKNIFAYSKDNEGRWKGKSGSHAPVIGTENSKITVETKHGMSERHYIVKHSIITAEGEVLGEHVFTKIDKKAISSYDIKGKHEKLYALSFCNLHDLWVTEFTI
ncbi:twin-arginine translocation signal domain-containing protein [Sulfurimonas sp. MAG313]|nr:desulfoferrodoxin family protein [Sulfurimonas sp. MAG313]MDF1881797.1 twin-arginine translocation signal domain-containing protein [Sulfurimonas sp. MAG313]